MIIKNKIYLTKPVIVSLTSWPKRIGNVVPVCLSMLKQTITPIIELTLSQEEFSDITDLPVELQNLINKKLITLNWAKNNTKAFKKLIPVISKYYNNEDYLLTIDDDLLYDKNYIEEMINCLKDNDSYCPHDGFVGGAMIYNTKIFDLEFIDRLTQEIVDTGIDDTYIYRYLLYKKAKMSFGPNGKILGMLKLFNEYSPLHDYYMQNNRIKIADELARKIWL